MTLFNMNDILQLIEFYSINTNPKIWVKDEFKNEKQSYSPSNIYINDDGDIIIEIDK